MSDQIGTAHVQQYKSNLLIRYQQEGSKLRNAVRFDGDVRGKVFFTERLGPTDAVKKLVRHGDTPLVNTPHSRRMGTLVSYEWADFIDPADKVRMLIDPQSAYVVNASNAFGRATDREIITAFTADAKEGEDGATVVPFPAAQKIAAGATGLTLAKIIQSSKILNKANVPMEDRFFIFSPDALEDVLNDATITDADFNSVRLLMSGTINQFMGYTWIMSTELPLAGTTRSLFAFHRRAMVLGVAEDIMVDVGPRRDKSNALQVFVSMHFGAVRVEDEGVVQVDIIE